MIERRRELRDNLVRSHPVPEKMAGGRLEGVEAPASSDYNSIYNLRKLTTYIEERQRRFRLGA